MLKFMFVVFGSLRLRRLYLKAGITAIRRDRAAR
jgi:hypothetical protein